MRLFGFFLIIGIFLTSQVLFAAAPEFGSTRETNYARALRPPKGKSLIYIYQRPQQGAEVSPMITLNKYKIGRIVPGSFTVWQLAPGKLALNVAGSEPAHIDLKSRSGNVYLFRLIVTRTESGTRAELESLPMSYRGELSDCRLLKNPRSITPPEHAPMPQRHAKAESVKAPVSRESKHRHTSRQARRVGGLSLQVKTGSLSIANQTQTIINPGTFDKTASGLLGIGVDYRSSSGTSYGGELLNYKAHFVTTASNATSEVNTYVALANAKQYYLLDSAFNPYVGIGFGVAVTSVSGAINGNTVGYAYQLEAGAEYRNANLGFFAEAKYLGASTKDTNNQKVDVSGSGIFAGITFYF